MRERKTGECVSIEGLRVDQNLSGEIYTWFTIGKNTDGPFLWTADLRIKQELIQVIRNKQKVVVVVVPGENQQEQQITGIIARGK